MSDDDAPEITAALFAKMKPMKQVTPSMAKAIKAARGRPKLENAKAVVSIRLSNDALTKWRALGTAKRKKLVEKLEKNIASAA
jgi:uncharacterized protein (DUF4415 family)